MTYLSLHRPLPRLLLAGALFIFATASRSHAQESACLIQVDKPFYVAGETIWYKLWLSAEYGDQPALILVQVIRPDGGIADRFYLRAAQGGADGYYRTPYGWTPGIYRLRFSATALRQGHFPELGVVELPVYNDLEEPDMAPEQMVSSAAEDFGDPSGLSLQIAISPDRRAYQPRDSARVAIEVRDAQGRPVRARLSTAVTDQLLCGGKNAYPGKVLFAGNRLPQRLTLDSLLPLYGTVRNAKGEPLHSPLLTAWVSPPDTGVTVSTTPGGDFQALLPAFRGEGTVQLFDYKDIVQAVPAPAPAFPSASRLRYSEEVLHYLERSRQRKKVYQLFDTLEAAPVLLPFSPPEVDREPDRRLRPGNYEGIETVSGFFHEVPTQLSFRNRKGVYSARMFNPAPHMKKNYSDPPVFIIDGRLTRDAHFVAGLDLEDIETIDLYCDYSRLRRLFGAIGRSGVAVIETKSKTLALPEADRQNLLPLNGLQPPAAFPLISASESGESDDLPAFRPQVYWEPSAQTDANGQAVLSFPLGDDLSRFRIFITARDAAGALGAGEAVVEVK